MSNNDEVKLAEISEERKSRHSGWTYLSFGMYQLAQTKVISASNIFLFYYYHAIVGLEPLLIFLATAIITIWYAFNDPLIGYLTDRNFKWTRRWGRHFPFIIVGAIPQCFSLVLIYSAPDARVNPWPAFLWFMMANGISETLLTTSDVSVGALRVDKFRTEGERRKYSFFFTPLDMIALVIGMTIPPLLLGFAAGNASYTIMALLVGVIALFFVLLFLPGAREDKIIIDRYYSREYKSMTFLKGISQVLKQRSFVSFWIQYATFGVATTIMTAMVVYLTTFILQVPTGDMTILFGISIIGALLSVP